MSTPPRLAVRPVMRLERRLTAPFASIGRVETRAAALGSAAAFALVGVAASLVAAFHLGDLLGLSSLWRGVLVTIVIGWVLFGDAVEPLGLRLRDLAGSLAGEVDTYRPVAAAWLSSIRATLLAAAVVVALGLVASSSRVAVVFALFAVALLASQAESVARRRAWSLSEGPQDRSSQRALGRDEELVRAVTRGNGRGGVVNPRRRPRSPARARRSPR